MHLDYLKAMDEDFENPLFAEPVEGDLIQPASKTNQDLNGNMSNLTEPVRVTIVSFYFHLIHFITF